MLFWLLVFFAYVVGSIPFGLLLGRLFADVDVRELGSGNIGATNVNRVLGRKLGAATLLCDLMKGTLPVLLARFLLNNAYEAALVGAAAFFGHCFPIYLRFKGGKGVATMFGILLPVSFFSALVGGIVWFITVKITRVSALGAIVACLIIPLAILYFRADFWLAGIFSFIMAVVLYRHRENIQRMRSGVEHKF